MQVVTLALACFGIVVLLLALSRWLAHRRWASAGHLALALALLLAAAWIRPVAANLATYDVRHAQRPVAQIYCERTSSRSYRVTLTRLPGGRMQVFEVLGDEWRIDARTLDWQGPAVDLGLRASYRLDRLSTRFVREPESDAPPSSYVLSDDDTGTDVWAQARTGGFWSNYAHADHAYGPWQPLADGARFDVTFDRGQLAARAANEPAAKALAAAPAASAVPAR